jgi:UDP-N-acetylmuramoylalanine--D-glutamate ligase
MSHYVVYGLGISGISALKFLAQNNQKIIAIDDNSQAVLDLESKLLNENFAFISNIEFLKFEDIKWNINTSIIFAPGIPLYHPKPHKILEIVNKYHCKLICDIELFYQEYHQIYNFIGITGTNGKSTTAALTNFILNHIGLPSEVGGNIGKPCFDLETLAKNSAYVLEMSSFQLDLTSEIHFRIASLGNITIDHIDRHGSMEEYIKTKSKIFNHQNANDHSVIGIDNDNSKKVFESLKKDPNFKSNLIAISTKTIQQNGVAVINGKLYNHIDGTNSEFLLGNIFLKGEHNQQNIAIAFANCYCYLKQQNLLTKIPESKIINAIKLFEGLRHRMQFLGQIDNINFINDSKATNAESTENALKVYDNIYWILGGKEKEGGIEIVKPYFKKIKKAYLIGQASDIFAKTLKDNQVIFEKCNNLENAFNKAFNDAKQDKIIDQKNLLLSPACASYDQWKSFEERGDYFCKLFEKILTN